MFDDTAASEDDEPKPANKTDYDWVKRLELNEKREIKSIA